MKKIVIIIFMLISFVSFSQNNKNEKPYIEVTGTAEKEVIPNEIYLDVYDLLVSFHTHSQKG